MIPAPNFFATNNTRQNLKLLAKALLNVMKVLCFYMSAPIAFTGLNALFQQRF